MDTLVPPTDAITPEEWQQTPPSVQAWIGELLAENKQLRETVEQLQEIVNRNSQNASQPPSQDRPDQKLAKEPSGPPRKRGGVFVHEGEVLAVVVHGDFGVVLGKDEQETADIARVLDIKNAAMSEISPRSRHGSDGLGTLTNRVVFTRKSKQYRFVLPKVLVA